MSTTFNDATTNVAKISNVRRVWMLMRRADEPKLRPNDLQEPPMQPPIFMQRWGVTLCYLCLPLPLGRHVCLFPKLRLQPFLLLWQQPFRPFRCCPWTRRFSYPPCLSRLLDTDLGAILNPSTSRCVCTLLCGQQVSEARAARAAFRSRTYFNTLAALTVMCIRRARLGWSAGLRAVLLGFTPRFKALSSTMMAFLFITMLDRTRQAATLSVLNRLLRSGMG